METQPRDVMASVIRDLVVRGVREPSPWELRILHIRFCDNQRAWMAPPTPEELRPCVEYLLASLRCDERLSPISEPNGSEVEALHAQLPDIRQRVAFDDACEARRWTRAAQATILRKALHRIRDAHANELANVPNASQSFLVDAHWITLGRELGL